jgi:type VII secretion integral membrane protein EccD
MMPTFTRLTLEGGARRVEVVVASDQPLGWLMPRFVDLTGVAPSGAYTLVRPIGDALDLGGDCAANQVADGELLYVVPRADAPAPPAVFDVTDTVAAARTALPGQWDQRARRVVGGAFVAAAAWLVAGAIPGPPNPDALVASLVVAWAVAVGTAVGCGRTGRTWGAIAACCAAAGLAQPTTEAWVAGWSGTAPFGLAGLAGWFLLGLVVLLGVGVGLRHPGALLAGGVGAPLALVGTVLVGVGLDFLGTCGVLLVVALGLTGLVPAWAIAVSGLTGLDDFATTGQPIERARVIASAGDAYRVVSWCLVALAVLAAQAGFWLAASDNPWALGLAGAAVAVLALRTRALPTAVQAGALWAAALVIVAAAAWGAPAWWRLGLVVAVVIVAVVAGAGRVSEPARVRLRRAGDVVEKLALVSTVPVLLGLFGVYPWLLGAFG